MLKITNRYSRDNETQRLPRWINKQDPIMCCLPEAHFKSKDTYRLKVSEWRNRYHISLANTNKKAGVVKFKPSRLQNKENYQG